MCERPGLPQGSLGPFVSLGLSGPESVARKPGCPKDSVSRSVSGMSKKVSRECARSVDKLSQTLLGTLSGHLLDTPEPGDTPWDTPLDTPVFGDTLGDTPGDTSGPRGPCSRQNTLQKGSRYRISVLTPHRRLRTRLRTPSLRTPFPRLLQMECKFALASGIARRNSDKGSKLIVKLKKLGSSSRSEKCQKPRPSLLLEKLLYTHTHTLFALQ